MSTEQPPYCVISLCCQPVISFLAGTRPFWSVHPQHLCSGSSTNADLIVEGSSSSCLCPFPQWCDYIPFSFPRLFHGLLLFNPFLGSRISFILQILLHVYAGTCLEACGADLWPASVCSKGPRSSHFSPVLPFLALVLPFLHNSGNWAFKEEHPPTH